MGRRIALILLFAFFLSCTTENEAASNDFSSCQNAEIFLMPHHLLVEDLIKEMYTVIPEAKHFIVISPDHFNQGTKNISEAKETEHGYTIHRNLIEENFGDVDVEGIMIKTSANTDELKALAERLSTEEAVFIFSIDFSHYLPGQVAYVHDLLAVDIIEARSIDEAKKIEADSPASIEVLLRLAKLKSLNIEVLRNTNPSLDANVETFENTTHLFACSSDGTPQERQLKTSMFFVHPREWYLGKTREDRYLFGYDETYFDQELAKDTAVITSSNGEKEFIEFDYFTP